MNTAIFEMSIYIGLVFCSMYIIVGFLVDYIGKKTILVVLLFITGSCGIVAHHVYNQTVAVALFAIFQMCGACIGLMNAVTVELFPTKYRLHFVIFFFIDLKKKEVINSAQSICSLG